MCLFSSFHNTHKHTHTHTHTHKHTHTQTQHTHTHKHTHTQTQHTHKHKHNTHTNTTHTHTHVLQVFSVFIHSVFCLTTGPKPPPKRFLHILRSRAFYFKWEYPLLSLSSSSRFLRLLPRLLVTSISPFIFPSITCFRRQFLRKMWPIQLAFCFIISCTIFLCSLTLSI